MSGKKPKLGAKVKPQKRPKRAIFGKPTSEDPTVIWGLSYVDLGGKWGWARIDVNVLSHVLNFMHNLEGMLPVEVFGPRHKRIEIDSLCPEAKKRLTEIELDDLDALWELHVTGLERIWGHRVGHVFYPVWWDPLHEVCPSKKRNT
ncbi:MAG: hypothetical protein AB7V58_12610 [Solirubrobacterales bacterium]